MTKMSRQKEKRCGIQTALYAVITPPLKLSCTAV